MPLKHGSAIICLAVQINYQMLLHSKEEMIGSWLFGVNILFEQFIFHSVPSQDQLWYEDKEDCAIF